MTTAKRTLFFKFLLLLEEKAFGNHCCLHAAPCVSAVIFLTCVSSTHSAHSSCLCSLSCAGEEALVMLLHENDGSQNNVYFNNQTLAFIPPPPGHQSHTTVMETLCVNRLMWECCRTQPHVWKVLSVSQQLLAGRQESTLDGSPVHPMTHQGAIYYLLSSFLRVCTGVYWDDVTVADESQLCKQWDWSVRGLLQLSRIHLKMVSHHTRQVRRSIYTDWLVRRCSPGRLSTITFTLCTAARQISAECCV